MSVIPESTIVHVALTAACHLNRLAAVVGLVLARLQLLLTAPATTPTTGIAGNAAPSPDAAFVGPLCVRRKR